jgi:hypothetical protein
VHVVRATSSVVEELLAFTRDPASVESAANAHIALASNEIAQTVVVVDEIVR